jgi:predicted RNA-binding protein Jag
MKSIIEQASSIMKAIEKAWDQAEKPKEFSIKIFEQEERNFFGMSTKPAKVGIFFSDKPAAHEKPIAKPRQEIKECRPEMRERPSSASSSHRASEDSRKSTTDKPTCQPQKTQAARPATSPKPAQQRTSVQKPAEQPQTVAAHAEKPQRTPAAWNDTMIATTHTWLKKTLSLMNMPTIEFNSEVAGKNLKLTFNTPLIADPMHEKQLFRSFAHLIMSSLRNQYKQEIKDLKVILIRPE